MFIWFSKFRMQLMNPYKRRKVACLTAFYQSFVNLKSNTMKKSRYKIMCFFNTKQVISKKNALKVCFITYNNFKSCVCRYFKLKKPPGFQSKAAFLGIY